MKNLPQEFIERFYKILPQEMAAESEKFFSKEPLFAVRVNTIKISVDEALRILTERGIAFERVSWCAEALVLPGVSRPELIDSDLVKDGCLYPQSLSSMLAAVVLAAEPGERILDMCAAPGSKATQIAAQMRNQGSLVCVEAIRSRFYRLKNVVSLLGVEIIDYKVMDSRRFRSHEAFDRILLDVPCSSEGRFQLSDEESHAYWSLRKIKEMRQKQRGIILNAGRLLKKGGVMVYSTCTFAPEENEAVIDWFLKKSESPFVVQPIEIKDVPVYPAMGEWGKKTFDPQVKNCLRVLPTERTEGFFIAKLVKA